MNVNDYLQENEALTALCGEYHLTSLEESTRIPKNIYKLISNVHNSITGHHGVEKTLRKLLRCNTTFNHMRKYVTLFIKQCPCCQKQSQIKIPIQTTPFFTSTYTPMSRIALDSIGELPEDVFGYKHVQVIIDTCTRTIELKPTRTVDAEEGADALIAWIGRYGAPSEIVTDNGTQYMNKLFEELNNIFQNEHISTIPYSKEENSIVERSNKEIMRHLQAYLYEIGKRKQWSRYLPIVQRILMSTVHSSTGIAPATLLYANQIDLDSKIITQSKSLITDEMKLSHYTADMIAVQNKLIDIAMKRQEFINNSNINSKNKHNNSITEFPINSFVLVQYPKTRMGSMPPTKLHTKLKGPLRVLSFIGAKYDLLNLVTNKTESHHVTNLRKFNYNPTLTDPHKVALTDNEESIVERILQHSGHKTKNRTWSTGRN
jgi:hypothetical protein